MESSTNQPQSLPQPQTPVQRQAIRLRIQQPPSELPPNPPQDVSDAGTDDKIPLSTTPAECNSPQNRKYKLYITENDSRPNPLRGEVTTVKNDNDGPDDDEDTALEVPLSPPSFRDSDDSDSDLDGNVFDANNDGNGNNSDVEDDDDDDGKDEMHPVNTTRNATNEITPSSSSPSLSLEKRLSDAPQRLPPRPAGVGVNGPASTNVRNDNVPKEEELQEFVESIVKGLVEIAHTITPSELIGTNTNLGIGGSGSVVKALYHGRYVAVKMFSPYNISFDRKEVMREAALMSVLGHPNLVEYVGACLQPKNMFIVTELYPASLHAVIFNKALDLTIPHILRISMGIANGMRFLHSLGLIHRDLKSANVLLTSDLDAKITDFGTARVVPRDKQMMMTGGIGTLEFMAPEILAHEVYSKEADVYSFAIVLWQMITRKSPFENLTMFSIPEHVCKGERPQIPASCPQRIALLIKSCWNPKPSLRPDFGEICRVLQVIAGLSPDTSEIAAEYYRKCGVFPAGAAAGDITEMEAGSVMLKCGRNGKPHFALFQLSDDSQYLQWTSKRNDPGRTRVKIDNIRELCLGQLTPVFARSGMEHYRSLSFSFVLQDRSVDIIATSQREFDLWTKGVRTLLPSGARIRRQVLSPLKSKGSSRSISADNNNDDEKSVVEEEEVGAGDEKDTKGDEKKTLTMNRDEDGNEKDDENVEHDITEIGSPVLSMEQPPVGVGAAEPTAPREKKTMWRHSSNGDRRRSKSLDAGERREFIGLNREGKASGITSRVQLTSSTSDFFNAKNREETKNVYTISLEKVELSSYRQQSVAFPSQLPQTLRYKTMTASGTSTTTTVSVSASSLSSLSPSSTLSTSNPSSHRRSMSETRLRGGKARWKPQELQLKEDLIGKDICAVAMGAEHFAALSIHGSVYMWGDNEFGQQGVVSHPPIEQPYQVFKNSTSKSTRNDDEDDDAVSSVVAIMPDPIKYDVFAPHLVPLGKAVVHSIACGKNHTMCATVDGALFSWGRNTRGQLGHGDTVQRTEPALVEALRGNPVIIIACGPHTSAAYTDSGKLYMWGQNDTYQLGLNHTRQMRSPKHVGSSFVTFLKSDSKGGRRSEENVDILANVSIDPTEVESKADTVPFAPYRKNVQLAKRVKHQQQRPDIKAPPILVPSSSVSSVGVNPSAHAHQMPSSSSSSSSSSHSISTNQTFVPSEQIEEIALGQYHSAVLTTLGTIWVWGKLGSTINTVPTITKLPGNVGGVQISSGDYHLAAIGDDERVYTWGDGNLGQLGRGEFDFCPDPRPVEGLLTSEKVRQVVCGPAYTAAVTSNGYVYTFGYGSAGRWNTQEESVPILSGVLKGKSAVRIACGPVSMCALVTQRRTPDKRLTGWIPDEEIKFCMSCKEPFGPMRRRHHCRKCEGVFCSYCSMYRAPILSKGFAKPVRVCLDCFSSLTKY